MDGEATGRGRGQRWSGRKRRGSKGGGRGERGKLQRGSTWAGEMMTIIPTPLPPPELEAAAAFSDLEPTGPFAFGGK